MAAPAKSPKAMSSRLMTMKFMQRAAASQPAEQPPSKRQRRSGDSSEARSIAAILAAEEQKRADAVEREAADRGESKWYLSYQQPAGTAARSPMNVVAAGYSRLDAGHARDAEADPDEQAPSAPVPGRKSFGKFNRAIEKQQNPDLSSSSDDDDGASQGEGEMEDGSDDDVENDPVQALIAQGRKEALDKARAQRKAAKKAQSTESARLADERRKQKINLNRLQSISGGGGLGGRNRPPSNAAKMACHKCGEVGHLMRDCPQAPSPRSSKSRQPH